MKQVKSLNNKEMGVRFQTNTLIGKSYPVRIVINLFLVLSLFILVVSCNSDQKAKLEQLRKQHDQLTEEIKKLEDKLNLTDSTQLSMDATFVAVEEVKTNPFNHFIEVQGRLDGDENVGVGAQAPGKIDQIFVSVGQNVSKGQLLAKLDDAVLQQQLKQLETNYELISDIYVKQKNLWEQKVGSEVQYLTAKTNKESMEQQMAVLKDQIKTFHIISPINGRIEDISIKVGQTVSPGFTLIRVINLNKTKVVAEIAEAYSSKINSGDKVKVFFPDINTETSSVVTFSSKFINPITRSFSVETNLNGNIPGLKANMVAVLKINDYHVDNAVSISQNLIQKDQKGNYVFVAENHSSPKALKKYVSTGQSYNGITEIKEGLKVGDLIVVAGFQDLEEGENIRY